MRGLGIQAEVLVSLAVVMVTATGLLGAFVFETQSAQLERLGPLLAGALTDEARTASLAYEGGLSGATWFVVSEDASGNERVRGVGAASGVLSPAGP